MGTSTFYLGKPPYTSAVMAMTASPPRRLATWSVTRRLPSRAASIFINRSSVNRPKSALRMREKSAAANLVSSAAFRTERPRLSRLGDDPGGQDRLGLFQVRMRIAEITKHITASLNQFEVAFAHGNSSLFSRPSRSLAKSISAFGVLIPVFDFFWNAWITHSCPATSIT